MTDNRPVRRSPRLQGYDYRQNGAYFVTICTHDRSALFGAISDGVMHLNELGKIAEAEWYETEGLRSNVELDALVVMPNHVHAIIVLTDSPDPTNSTNRQSSAGSLSTIVGAYKSAVTKQVNHLRDTLGAPLWQARFHDHIIRNEADLNRIREYVVNNPARWTEDVFYGVE